MEALEGILALDGKIFTVLNGAQVPWLDPVMMIFSNREVWAVLYICVVIYMFRRFGWKKGLIALAFMILTVTFNDQTCNFFKNTFCRLRPSHNPQLNGIVNLLEDSGGMFGFPSGHATCSFGYAFLTSMIIKRKPYTIGIMAWAALVSYSRIYVGKHYLLDILCGAALGTAEGLLMAALFASSCRLLKVNVTRGAALDIAQKKS